MSKKKCVDKSNYMWHITRIAASKEPACHTVDESIAAVRDYINKLRADRDSAIAIAREAISRHNAGHAWNPELAELDAMEEAQNVRDRD